MPFGRWGNPDDAARLVAWLASDDGRWITGQVIDSEGGVPAVGLRLGSGNLVRPALRSRGVRILDTPNDDRAKGLAR
jgi:hypothetical protein